MAHPVTAELGLANVHQATPRHTLPRHGEAFWRQGRRHSLSALHSADGTRAQTSFSQLIASVPLPAPLWPFGNVDLEFQGRNSFQTR